MFTAIFLIILIPAHSGQFEDDLNAKESSQVEIRAVFINCQINEKHSQYGNEISRFQREEFFKHNALRDCNKKLALTVKMTSDSGHSSSDEYIPIEHVFDGSIKKRVRLLNPYILRLRREPPFEVYKLQELDVFTVLLTNSNEQTYETNRESTNVLNGLRGNSHFTDTEAWMLLNHDKDGPDDEERDLRTQSLYINNTRRHKRFDFDTKIQTNPYEDNIQTPATYHRGHTYKNNKNKLSFNVPYNTNLEGKNVTDILQSEDVMDSLAGTEKKFHLYEVGDPNILFKAQVQLLEKMSTPQGKTIWKDLTKHESARISSLCPEWTNRDVYIRYRCAEWFPEDFTLPSTGICLLLPENEKLNNGFSHDKLEDFIIVPFEDIKVIEESGTEKRSYGDSNLNSALGSEKELHHRILVRLSRALFGRNEDNFIIINEESGKYLRIPYRQPHNAQIELEAKADENQLVYVGSSGRLTTAVSESTRRTRAILTVQVTNTGLAAARLRAKIRECTPELLRFNEDETEIAAKPILIPPMHTHKFCLEIPLELPGDIAHCSVALLNDGDESIAVRDVRIKRDEDPKLLCQEMTEYQQVAAGLAPLDTPRHVRAACYPDVPTINLLVIAFGVVLLLLILGMLKACLGLFLRCVGSWGINKLIQTPRRLDRYYERSLRNRTVMFDDDGWPVHPDTLKRTVRLVSKPMEFMLNIIFFVTMPCLMLFNSLKLIISRCQNKEKGGYDGKTKNCCSPNDIQGKGNDAQWRWRRRRRHLSRWMSPQAEQLSTDIWRNGLPPHGFSSPECMRPLLQEDQFRGNKLYKLHSPIVDSEQDDTEYVLMQMQNSRKTLAKDLHRFKPSSIKD